MSTYITRDQQRVAGPFETSDEAFGALLRMVPYSVDHATTYEGYGFEDVDEDDEPRTGTCAHCGGEFGETEDGILLHVDETFDHLVRPVKEA